MRLEDDGAYKKAEKWGAKLNALLIYRPLSDVGSSWLHIDGSKQIQLVLEVNVSNSDIVSGSKDRQLREVAKTIRESGKQVWIRPLHEFNLEPSVYKWCIYPFTPEKVEMYKKSWRHIVSIFREEKANVKFQWCINGKNPRDDKTPYSTFYPGDDVVDFVGVDLYNRCGISSNVFSSFKTLFTPCYDQLIKFNKPIFIGETSSTGIGGDKAAWVRDAWEALARDFPKVKTVNFFLEDKGDGQWGLHTQREIDNFVNGCNAYAS